MIVFILHDSARRALCGREALGERFITSRLYNTTVLALHIARRAYKLASYAIACTSAHFCACALRSRCSWCIDTRLDTDIVYYVMLYATMQAEDLW